MATNGRQLYCKECKRLINLEINRQWRLKNKKKRRIYFKEYEKTPQRKTKHHIRWNSRYNTPIPNGTLCIKCKVNLSEERHHPDYNKAKDVMFVCKKCHIKIHNGVDEE